MRLALIIGGTLAAFLAVGWITRPKPPRTHVTVVEVSCQYKGTDSMGAHLYQVQARGIAKGPSDIQLFLDTDRLPVAVPVECAAWGAECYRDPYEGKETEWTSELEFGTYDTPYKLEIKASTRPAYVKAGSRNSPRIDRAQMTVVCDTPSEPIVAEN